MVKPTAIPVSERRLRQFQPAAFPGEAPSSLPALRASPPSAIASDALVEQVVGELRSLSRSASLELAFRVGELVVATLYAGDTTALRERGRKDTSFRRLAAHPELPFSAATLWRSVAVYELLCKMPGLRAARNLGLSHLHAVLGLPSTTQERLLVEAQREGWTAERLARVADSAKQKDTGKGGRPKTPAALRSLQEFHRRLEEGGDEHNDLVFLGRLSDDETRELRAMALQMKAWCEQVAVEAERRLGGG